MTWEISGPSANSAAFNGIVASVAPDLRQVSDLMIWRDGDPRDPMISQLASTMLQGFTMPAICLEGCARQIARRQAMPVHEVLAAVDLEMQQQLTMYQFSTDFAPDDWYLAE